MLHKHTIFLDGGLHFLVTYHSSCVGPGSKVFCNNTFYLGKGPKSNFLLSHTSEFSPASFVLVFIIAQFGFLLFLKIGAIGQLHS